MSHTPEPWIFTVADDFYCGSIMGRHGGEVFDGDFTEANARRIVACVNACDGVPTEVLEEGGQGTVAASMARLTEQRDKLLAELDELESAREMLRAYNNMLVEIADALDVAPYHLTTPMVVENIKRLHAIKAAALNLAKVKGRYNSEIAMNKLLEALK